MLELQKLQTELLELQKLQIELLKLQTKMLELLEMQTEMLEMQTEMLELQTELLEMQTGMLELQELQTELLELQGLSQGSHLQVPLQSWAPAMSGAIGGAQPAAHATHPMPGCVIQPLPPAPGSLSRQGPIPLSPPPPPPSLAVQGTWGQQVGMLLGWRAALPSPSAPHLQNPALRHCGFGFFLQCSREILLHGAA